LIIAEPYGGCGRYADWARRNLANAIIRDINGKAQVRLEPMPRPDSVIRNYIRTSKTFHTITPIILPGFDDLKYKKAEKLLMKSIEQAGFPIEDLADWHLQKAPFKKSSYGPHSYKMPDYLQKKSSMHVRLKSVMSG
jgi:CRISPR-associated protein Csb2